MFFLLSSQVYSKQHQMIINYMNIKLSNVFCMKEGKKEISDRQHQQLQAILKQHTHVIYL